MKIKTIWHWAFAFFETSDELTDAYYKLDVEHYYKGKIKDLTYEKACGIAQIHPNAIKYQEQAMMPLFQGKGKLSTGTESPVRALESYKSKDETDMPYILIWKMYDNEN